MFICLMVIYKLIYVIYEIVWCIEEKNGVKFFLYNEINQYVELICKK